MHPDTFFQKWKHDIEMLEDAYVSIQHKKSSKLWLPICFFIMATATVLILLFMSEVFQINIKYFILYAIFGFYQIFKSMSNEYEGVCDNEIAAYDTICLLHSLSPELLVEYTEYRKTNEGYDSHYRLGYIPETIELLRAYEKSKNY